MEIEFGKRPTVATLWDGCWNPAYRYKKKLEHLPYYPLLKISMDKDSKITDINIVFAPNHWKYKADKKYLPLSTPNYNWANPYFWIGNGFYPKCEFRRIEDVAYNSDASKFNEFWNRHPIEEDFEIIFNDIWKICVIKEEKTFISQEDFTNYIWLIRFLIENTLVFQIDELTYNEWERYTHQYLAEADSVFPTQKEHRSFFEGWVIKKGDSTEKIKTTFFRDIKKILNLFLEKIKPDNGAGIFLHKIYDSYIDELIKKKLFIKCAQCGSLANYYRGKKRCSLKSDGKNCSKKGSNYRYYQSHKPKLKSYYRKEMKHTRNFYRKRGIKK